MNQTYRLPMVNNNRDVDDREHSCLCNHDVTTCLNMLHIVRSLCENGPIPEWLRRNVPQRSRRHKDYADDLQDQHSARRPRNQSFLLNSYHCSTLDALGV